MDAKEFMEGLNAILNIQKDNENVRRSLKEWQDIHANLEKQYKQFKEVNENNYTVLYEQINFMKDLLKGILKSCEDCKGEGGFGVDMGEAGWDFERCNTCLGTGLKLLPPKTQTQADKKSVS